MNPTRLLAHAAVHFLIAFALLVALVLAQGCGPRQWNRTDTAAQVALTASLAADYTQTRAALDDGWEETNPIMGSDGKRLPPEIYFPVCALASFAVARELPRPWRSLFQVGVLALQVDSIRHNWSAGYAVTW